MSDSHQQLKERAAEDGIEFFFAMFVDMHGKPCAKLVPIESIDMLLNDGVGFAGFAAGPMGQTPADPDLIAIPDPSSYTVAPWQPGLAILQCDIHVEGQEWPFAPRIILKRQVEKLRQRGMVYKTGVEAEYYLVRQSADGRSIEVADPLDVAPQPCYDAKGLTRMYEHLTSVSTYMNRLGWGNYANDHEDGNGQFEQNWEYADALTTADRTVFFRLMVHTMANKAGMAATFMPKPFTHLTGNGLHVHSSLWDAASDTTLFLDEEDPRGLGISKLAYQFAAGLIENSCALVAVTAPTVNSYKRIGVGAPTSGASWAPAYATYGGNNRSQMLRIPEPGRIENRLVDGSANPYLAFAATLGAGMDGIDRELDPGKPNTDNLFDLSLEEIHARGIQVMPHTLAQAAQNLPESTVIREALGSDYVDYFIEIKMDEYMQYKRFVTAWEIERYVTLY
jgi:glutamine synthetase